MGGSSRGTTKLGRYVGHWSVQKLGVGGSEGRQGGGGKEGGGGVGAWGLRRNSTGHNSNPWASLAVAVASDMPANDYSQLWNGMMGEGDEGLSENCVTCKPLIAIRTRK